MEALDNIPEPPKIRVVVRKRPLTQQEGQARDIVEVEGVGGLAVKEIKSKVDLTKYIEEHLFEFDNAYSEEADNQQIYQECVLPLVSETFKGAKTTCFAYG